MFNIEGHFHRWGQNSLCEHLHFAWGKQIALIIKKTAYVVADRVRDFVLLQLYFGDRCEERTATVQSGVTRGCINQELPKYDGNEIHFSPM